MSSYRENLQFRWEGTPETVINYQSYVIAFDADFIEIRSSETVSFVIVNFVANVLRIY